MTSACGDFDATAELRNPKNKDVIYTILSSARAHLFATKQAALSESRSADVVAHQRATRPWVAADLHVEVKMLDGAAQPASKFAPVVDRRSLLLKPVASAGTDVIVEVEETRHSAPSESSSDELQNAQDLADELDESSAALHTGGSVRSESEQHPALHVEDESARLIDIMKVIQGRVRRTSLLGPQQQQQQQQQRVDLPSGRPADRQQSADAVLLAGAAAASGAVPVNRFSSLDMAVYGSEAHAEPLPVLGLSRRGSIRLPASSDSTPSTLGDDGVAGEQGLLQLPDVQDFLQQRRQQQQQQYHRHHHHQKRHSLADGTPAGNALSVMQHSALPKRHHSVESYYQSVSSSPSSPSQQHYVQRRQQRKQESLSRESQTTPSSPRHNGVSEVSPHPAPPTLPAAVWANTSSTGEDSSDALPPRSPSKPHASIRRLSVLLAATSKLNLMTKRAAVRPDDGQEAPGDGFACPPTAQSLLAAAASEQGAWSGGAEHDSGVFTHVDTTMQGKGSKGPLTPDRSLRGTSLTGGRGLYGSCGDSGGYVPAALVAASYSDSGLRRQASGIHGYSGSSCAPAAVAAAAYGGGGLYRHASVVADPCKQEDLQSWSGHMKELTRPRAASFSSGHALVPTRPHTATHTLGASASPAVVAIAVPCINTPGTPQRVDIRVRPVTPSSPPAPLQRLRTPSSTTAGELWPSLASVNSTPDVGMAKSSHLGKAMQQQQLLVQELPAGAAATPGSSAVGQQETASMRKLIRSFADRLTTRVGVALKRTASSKKVVPR